LSDVLGAAFCCVCPAAGVLICSFAAVASEGYGFFI
jgi:hypothetical protein